MAKPKKSPLSTEVLSEFLRKLPVDQRAETIIAIHKVAAREFALMVLEHVKPAKPKRRRRP